MELLTAVVAATELVVGGAFFRIRQHRIGLVDLLHAGFGIGLLADIRMVFARHPTVSLFDLVGGCGFVDAENLVVIPEFHAGEPPGLMLLPWASRLARLCSILRP